MRLNRFLLGAPAVALGLAGCGGILPLRSKPSAARLPLSGPSLYTFDGGPSRPGALPAGPSLAALRGARRIAVRLPGTVDSAALVVPHARIDGAFHTAVVVTTSYGKTVAVDGRSGRILWTYTPPDYKAYAGTEQLTNATPFVAGAEPYIYAPDPDGLIRKLSLADGREVKGGWPVRVTELPTREKLSGALNGVGPYLLVATGGYYGDIPPYQGHLVVIDRQTGRLVTVFNTLCADRRRLQRPASCPASDAAIWSRAAAVLAARGQAVAVVTGNGPYNGRTAFGDSALLLSLPKLRLVGAYTPPNQRYLAEADLDLGSGGPAVLGPRTVLLGGKDGLLRVVRFPSLRRYHHNPASGLSETLPTPGGAPLFTQPAVWHHGGETDLFVADGSGSAAYRFLGGHLQRLWENAVPGTSPFLAGSLLYIYNPLGGGLNVYNPFKPRPLLTLPAGAGHFNSPTVGGGIVVEPEGNANLHLLQGTLSLYLPPNRPAP